MTSYSRALRNSPLTPGIGGLLAALACAVALSGCEGDKNTTIIQQPPALPVEAPRVVYRGDKGQLIPIDADHPQAGPFQFYAWLQNLPKGIDPAKVAPDFVADPLNPLLAEQIETAPSFTQNLAVAWVGFTDAAGAIHPVIGADVRWEIDQEYAQRISNNGSTQFGTSDDNRISLGYGVFDDQADTRTNNKDLVNERFPLIATEFPLYNQSGIGTPFVDGFTWVTLFSPDTRAAARIVAVATINGEEIGKQILYKYFAPTPKIEVTKTVSTDVVNIPAGGTSTVTWTVTVKNVGSGNAATVDLRDFLASLPAGATYTLGALPPGVTPAGTSGFTYSFPLDSPFTAPPPGPLLGSAQSFAVLGASTVTNTGTTTVSGDVGVSAGSAVTGLLAADVTNGTIHNNDAAAQAAQVGLTAAYVDLGDASKRPCTAAVNTPLSNATLGPGVYCYSTDIGLTGPLVLDGQGNPSAEFVFRIGTALTTAAGSSVTLINGASACNVYWQLGSSATLGSGTDFAGNILAQASVTVGTGASISGRALARVGGVTLSGNTIDAPLACAPQVPVGNNTKTLTFTATVNRPGTYCNDVQIDSYADDATPPNVYTPIDLKDEACFNAIQSSLAIVKDFVAADGTTSLGKNLTVAKDVSAKLRVRVINSGSGSATAVQVSDAFTAALSTGTLGNYHVSDLPAGSTANNNGGFDTAAADLPGNTTRTLLFTVAASADGKYCDTATITAPACTAADCSDTACLTVETPVLTITKADAPASVLPGGTYTSTIVVTNSGNATAKNVVITDALGLNSAANVRAIYVSSSLNGLSGTLGNNEVKSSSIDILAGESLTFTVVSRIPLAAPACATTPCYCDTASVTSSNAASPTPAQACVTVPATTALQTQLVDLNDPVAVGGDVTYFSVLYVEALSNQGVGQNKLTYSFGLVSPTVLGIPGVFQVTSTKVYLDSAPVRDPVTGVVTSDTSNATAVLKAEGPDYTLATELGKQVITMSPGVILAPNTALYVVNVVRVPAGTAVNKLYTTSYIWDSVGLVGSTPYQASSSEPTTVLP